ncbi:tail component protein [Klebsiella pneumoniae subsp. pneumoniae]|uniref:Tail component protein n=1 Tax=Klebsiella pneumoniae subsp. pneumoniae TaxID=72407 RepID=A0A377Z2C4_KLEPN|nr:tail component protein [Klebsiella pneumoniae subsp. pneumoniae]
MQAIAQQGDTLDMICARYYGRTEGVFESVLAANPGLPSSVQCCHMAQLLNCPTSSHPP